MNLRLFFFTVGLASLSTLGPTLTAEQAANPPLPAPGQWDGVTEKAKLDRPYEQPLQAYDSFPLISYFLNPWRAYMDTQPASQFLGSMGFNGNNPPETRDAVMQMMSEAGIRVMRFEDGWGNFDWNNQCTGPHRDELLSVLALCKKHNIRPLLLLNSHHAVPCPIRYLNTQLMADAKKGDRTMKIKPDDVAKIHLGYTGPMDVPDYCAAKPMILHVQPDGTCQLSCPLPQDIKAGSLQLIELKFQPLHGSKLQGADAKTTADLVASEKATEDGWRQYVAQICDAAIEGLGTKGQPDAGFDLEVWNEQTFGSNFLDLNNYYDPKLNIADTPTYQKDRPLGPGIRPDAQTHFQEQGAMILVGITADYVRSRPELAMVNVDDGVGNQWPWNGGGNSWPGENAFSRHFYQGGWRDIDPQHPNRPNLGLLNNLGQLEGTPAANTAVPGHPAPTPNFLPSFRVGFPEWVFSGFQPENLVRDVLPDSRWGSDPLVHGRFTQNGDYQPQRLWETEVNDDHGQFFTQIFAETKAKNDDPRAYALDSYMASKLNLRQYLFSNHKGLRNFYIFAADGGAYSLGMVEPPFYTALKAANNQLTDAVRKEIPAYFKGLGWFTKQMEAADHLAATRALRVDELWEYKPRLMYAGDGTPQHPNQWNRDWFALLPYQLTANKFLIPYYVVTVNAFQDFQPKLDPLDPMRYQMPDQDFDVTIGNCAGAGAKVSVYDPITNTAVPVSIVDEKTSATQLTVKLKTTDYPRFLLVEEAQPGPLIQNPQVTTDEKGTLQVAWQTNIPVSSARVTYGKDWPNRSANEKLVPVQDNNSYAVQIPTGAKGVLAARIAVSANGLSCSWPRWDEDFQGQVVVPGSKPGDVTPLTFNNSVADTSKVAATALTADQTVSLPVEKTSRVYGYKIQLPARTVFSGGAENDQEAILDARSNLRLRIHYIPGGNHSPIDGALPFQAVGDTVSKTPVKLPSGKIGTMVDMEFVPAQHPELNYFAQKALFLPTGLNDGDLLVFTAEGSPDVVKSNDSEITSIFASYDSLDSAPAH